MEGRALRRQLHMRAPTDPDAANSKQGHDDSDFGSTANIITCYTTLLLYAATGSPLPEAQQTTAGPWSVHALTRRGLVAGALAKQPNNERTASR